MIVINEGLNSLDTDEIDIILGNIKRDYPGIRLIWIDNKSRYTNFFNRSIHLQAGKIIKIEESESEDTNNDSMESRSSSTPNDQSKLVDSNEKLSLLNGIPLFRFLDTPNLLLLSENCDTLTLPEGERLFNQGDPGDALYIIIEGKADILISSGEEQFLRECSANDAIGELALISDKPRSATVVASTDLLLLRLKREIFLDIVRSNGEISLQVMKVVIDRFHDTNLQMIKRIQA
ncbi:MAG: cyclic nucleotide-binding domain-containing protein [Granulosicoccus sp.]|nr:cyclic nucleotide-binding domain-containing protein [Granulosicoccus sp.]